jgi:nitrite reductase (NADH) large subunit
MKVVIIGAGVAAQTVMDSCRKEKNIKIEVYTEEPYPYYSRVFLPNYIARERTLEQLLVRKESWYKENHIQFHKNEKIIGIDLEKKQISSQTGKTVSYDKLVLALGSSARKLDFGNPNPDLKGNFALRTIADAKKIRDYIEKEQVEKAFIIGGGLLGIELGFHLRKLINHVHICEIAPHLLPRQLDRETSKILKQYLESKGLEFILGESVDKILGNSKVEGVKTQSGTVLKTHLVLQQLGIIPNIELAKNSGLKTNKGILVNEYMQTSDPDVYAVGDCIEFDGKIWGIIPASMEQAKQAAAQLLNKNPEPYKPSVWNTRLKIAGIDLTCIGLSSPEADQGATLFEYKRQDTYTCRKVLIRNDVLTNAILLGPGADTKYFMKKAGKHVNPEEVKEKINE